MAKKWEKSPQELIEKFYKVMENFPEVELRKMFGYPCAFLNGNMCVGLHESSLIVRLEEEDRSGALEQNLGTIFAPMKGRVMKEYVSLAQSILQSEEQLTDFVKKSLEYVQTLPPKIKKKRS